MDKLQLIKRLKDITEELYILRNELEQEEKIEMPYWYHMPISELRLPGMKYPNIVYNACAEHLIVTIGQLVMTGRASVTKWQKVGPHSLDTIAVELKERFNIDW